MLDPLKIKKDFPIFKRKINGHPIVFLDNAASTEKPKCVIDAIKDCYENYYANIHRGIYSLSEESTDAYESARKKTAEFINAKSESEIIFTRNATEAINLVAYSWGNTFIKKGDEIILSVMEHHSNLVPWQELASRKGAKLKIIPIKKDFTLDFEAYKKLLSKKTKLLSLTAMSNVLGTITPVKKFIKEAKKYGAKVLIDGAQSIPHLKTNVQYMNCDFLVFSSHKMLGPTGVGVLYGKKEILEKMPPFLHGGDMIREVTQFKSTYNDLPWKFEAGTPNIVDVIAFKKAIEYIESIGLKNIEEHERKLLTYAKEKFSKYKNVHLYSPKTKLSGGILSFNIKDIHPHDVATIFNTKNVCIRASQHCASPLMKALNVGSTNRISFYIYNTLSDIDEAEKALKNVLKIFKV